MPPPNVVPSITLFDAKLPFELFMGVLTVGFVFCSPNDAQIGLAESDYRQPLMTIVLNAS